MKPTGETRASVRTESNTPVVAALKSKGVEIAEKVLPENTRKWLTEAASHLQRGSGRHALETISIPPSDKSQTEIGIAEASTTETRKTVGGNGSADSITAESKTVVKTSHVSEHPEATDELKDDEMAMGMRRTEEKKEPTEVKPVTVEKPEEPPEPVKQQEAGSDDMLQGRNIEALVQQKDNPQAQVAAIVLISNAYRNFNVRNDGCMSWLAAADVGAISQSLGLNAESIESSRKALLDARKHFGEITSQREEASQDLGYDWKDSKPELQKQFDGLITQERQAEAEAEMERLYRELMLPIRTAVLASTDLSEAYKLNVIEGVKGYGDVLPQEDSLLKQTYTTGNETVKRQIADTVMFNIGHDLNSFDVIPIKDLRSLGADVDKIFIATLGNTRTNSDFVETRVAPVFFPEESPAKVRQCYEVLKKVTSLENQSHETSFYSDGYKHDAKSMNVDIFKNFMNNSETLIPVVEALSDYGFKYRPSDSLEGKFTQEYIDVLKELGQNLAQLRSELDSIKAILPDYKYDFKVDTRYPATKSERETYIDDNPFTIALKRKIYPYSINSADDMNKAVQLFESLQKVVPDRWKGGFTSTFIEMMSTTAGYSDKTPEVTRRAISEANKYVFDESMTPEQVELFATEFFKSSLDAKNGNVETAVKFCEKYGDRIRTSVDDQKRVDANFTWYKLSLLASDLYRYPISAGKEEVAIAKAKSDLAWASEAVTHINKPVIKDKAIANLIYALTDEEIGNMEKAKQFVDMMQDEALKKDAQAEIELEKERADKGETTTWKKMEKVRRTSAASEKLLKDLFGYGSAEDLAEARDEYAKLFHRSPDYWATFNPENQAKFEQELARIRGDYHVTLNITWANVLGTLETGRVISAWENTEVMEYRNTTRKYHYETRRDEIERLLGNRAKGGIRDPHPIYGAAASPNGRDEFYGGTGGGYGECFFVLKSDSIRDRTSFVYDDSFDGYNRWTLDWEGGLTAKAILNLNGSQSRHGYVEAEILGGVTMDDIESINIPSDAISGENKYGFSAGADALAKIDELRQKYPGVKINIIQVPTT